MSNNWVQFNLVIVKGLKPSKSNELKFLSFDKLKRLVAELSSDLTPRYISRYIILFPIATAARYSENIGLTWDCIDFEAKTVTINKTWERDKKILKIQRPSPPRERLRLIRRHVRY